ncbi:MAG: hypothetical protein E7262_01780 [Lachnospiraceae bacterium]|nr:hypothetical protein [Lachnospiraceae bacterium]
MNNKIIKRIVALSLITAIICASVGCTSTRSAEELVKESTEADNKKAEATEEPYIFLNEWDGTLFEVFGFTYLEPPRSVYYPTIEKGRTYLLGEFHTDELETFLVFFRDVYTVMWGEVVDILQVLEEKDKVYSFEGEYVVPSIYREVIEDGYDDADRVEKHAYLKVIYDENEGKCTLECRMIDKSAKKAEESDKGTK